MGHTSGGGRVDAVALLARRVLRTRERTVATYVAVVHVEIEHGAEHGPEGVEHAEHGGLVEHDDRQLSLFADVGGAAHVIGADVLPAERRALRPMVRASRVLEAELVESAVRARRVA